METTRCIFCDIEGGVTVIEENGYSGVQCPKCGLIYISPRPSRREISNLYGHDSAKSRADALISMELLARLYARHHLRLISPFVRSGELLEIGAGGGYFLDEARKAGFHPHALELNPYQAAFMRDRLGIPCEETPLTSGLFGGKRFDLVYHCDVMSHLFDPIADLEAMNGIINEGGYLVFETGNGGEIDQRYYRYFSRFQYPDHLFFFTVANLVDLVERTGFECVQIRRYSILPELIALKWIAGVRGWLAHAAGHARLRSAARTDGSEAGCTLSASISMTRPKPRLKRMARTAHDYFQYFLRYEVGRLALKDHRPQTVIVIARKE